MCIAIFRRDSDEIETTALPDEIRLINFLLRRQKIYGGNMIRPVMNRSQPVTVRMELYINNILNVQVQ